MTAETGVRCGVTACYWRTLATVSLSPTAGLAAETIGVGAVQVAIEVGPKGKKVVAVARDWPGLSRGAASEELAIERLRQYFPRYARVAKRAGMMLDDTSIEVVERYQGTGSTDFWGISFGFSEFDRLVQSNDELERELALMQACWAEFDDVRHRVSAELRKGPRGGGRDRDRIVQHTIAVECDWSPSRERGTSEELPLTGDALRLHRERYCTGIRALHAEGRLAGRWPLRFLVRHTAFHTMDHAWEMEDKDLSQSAQ